MVKCRPPENRVPEKDEVSTCIPFPLRQIGAIQPKAVVCLGSVAAQTRLNTNKVAHLALPRRVVRFPRPPPDGHLPSRRISLRQPATPSPTSGTDLKR